jgi:nickel transport system ATP-binding protein
MPLLELQDITKTYRQGKLFGKNRAVEVLCGVNLKMYAGTCTGLLGESGCGKSTAGRILTGLENASSGTVYYKGKALPDLTKEERKVYRRNCQVVFQNSHAAVNPRWRAWEILTEPLGYFEKLRKAELRERAELLLRQVGLAGDALDKRPFQFSGGELQRICIARSISLNPEFILLDESVSALDMYNQSLILELLAELKNKTGGAFLFISHDLRVLLKMSDSLAVMDQGRISMFASDLSSLEQDGAVYDDAFVHLAQAAL